MRIALALAATVLVGCAPQLTEIVVVVDSDLPVPTAMDGVEIRVSNELATTTTATRTGMTAATLLPSTVGVRPQQDTAAPVTIVAAATLGGSDVVTSEVRTHFVPGRRVVLQIFLSSGCRSVTCARGQTCRGGSCVDSTVDPNTLPPYDGGLPFDAGVVEGGATDAPSADAGDAGDASDAAPTDAGDAAPPVDAGDAGPADAGGCVPACDDGNPCTNDVCVAGACTAPNAPAGTGCPGGACDGTGGCCTGCLLGGACQPGLFGAACGYGGHTCATTCTCTLGVCDGAEWCTAYIDVSAIGTTVIPLDTCTLRDDFQFGMCMEGPGPPLLTPDAVLSGSAPGTYMLTASDPGWTIGSLDDSGSCTAGLLSCSTAGTWGTTGGSVSGRFYWGIEKTDGTCGRVTITVQHS